MSGDAQVKAAAWLSLEAAEEALAYLDTAADRGGVECQRKLRSAILAVGARCRTRATAARRPLSCPELPLMRSGLLARVPETRGNLAVDARSRLASRHN